MGAVDWEAAKPSYQEHVARYETWIANGNSHRMEYLVRGQARRRDPTLLYPELKSILAVGLPYSAKPLGFMDPREGPRYARYLRGEDYHVRVKDRMEAALAPFQNEIGHRVFVDTSAVLERAWASITGLGWIGKNTMLIHPQHGSYLLLGIAFLDRELGMLPSPQADYCGSCTRCLKGCPTGAFPEPRVLDARKCISSWTLETRGELGLSEGDVKAVSPWIAGCDLCQEVCPFNRKSEKRAEEEEVNLESDAPYLLDWKALDQESEEAYRARTRSLALSRVKPREFRRNLALIRPH